MRSRNSGRDDGMMARSNHRDVDIIYSSWKPSWLGETMAVRLIYCLLLDFASLSLRIRCCYTIFSQYPALIF